MKDYDLPKRLVPRTQRHKTEKQTDDLINCLEVDNIKLYVLCCERHREEQDLLHVTLTGGVLGSRSWRQICRTEVRARARVYFCA
jgi:hypothetical protein